MPADSFTVILLPAAITFVLAPEPVFLNPRFPDRLTKFDTVAVNPVTPTTTVFAATFSVFVTDPTVTDAAESDVSLL